MLIMRFVFFAALTLSAQPQYSLLLKGGHVIDPKNGRSAKLDLAIANNRVAKVAADIPESQAQRTARVDGLYVTPGLIDIHVHVYTGTGVKALTGDSSVYPDGFSFRSGVTTMVDAGSAGWRNFDDFRQRIIDRAQTRVLAFVNIVGNGMSPAGEDDSTEMQSAQAAAIARKHKDVVVGFKTAHFGGEGWPSIDGAIAAGRATNLPIMVDFGYLSLERTLRTLLGDKMRAGDIYTHCYSGHRGELGEDGKVNSAMVAGRKRGVLFDVGHGGGSFYWNVAKPLTEQGFWPDSISTDLHTGSMNAGMKDMTNVMSKILNLGAPLEEVIKLSTWNPARQIQRPELGHMDEGAVADITVLRLDEGKFGFIDSAGAAFSGSKRLTAELTIKDGRVHWDLNGAAATGFKDFKYQKRAPVIAPSSSKKKR
ncbi:MAG: amidohydrolase/deacetylase family metallohydrolase [Acidobacteria bacterium]|nr:amidohydrolase/deacetylase family metallohydrolase [Acidobacteriota bacterium]